MADDAVLYESEGGVATLTLNRPENRNSMTADVLIAFHECIRRLREDSELRAVVITGRGSSFCAGADFKSGSGLFVGGGPSPRLPHEAALRTYAAFLALLDVEVPILAAMNGHAIGGGFGLALVCDIRVANREAKYGANFARLGIHSGMAISYLLPRIVGVARAADMLFSGRILTGTEAEAIGLVHCAVSAEEVANEAKRRAREIASCAPLAVRLMKRSLYRGMNWDPRTAAEHEAWAQSATFASEDAKEGIRALLEKREPRFQGK